jgi:hypothetical protein
VLRSGDMILAVNGQPVSSFTDVESVIAAAAGEHQAAAAAAAGTGSIAAAAAADGAADPAAAAAAERPAKRPRSTADGLTNSQQQRQQQQDMQQPSVTLTLFRSGCVMDCQVGLGQEDSLGTDRLVHWCGAQLQTPHRSVRELGFQPEGKAGVFISRWHHGSPAHRYRTVGGSCLGVGDMCENACALGFLSQVFMLLSTARRQCEYVAHAV